MDDVTKRWVRGEADRRAVAEGCWFDLAAASRVRAFFEQFLVHTKGQFAGRAFELLPWQWRDVIGPLFGWMKADGTRRYRRAYIEIPKKNGKSALCSAIGLYGLTHDREPGAEVYVAASDKEQAGIIFNESKNMVEQSEKLSSILTVVKSTRRIIHNRSRSIYRALSADVPSKEGLNSSLVLFDELHVQPNRDLWDTLAYSGSSRRQPLQIAITTAGYDRHSICWEQHEYALKVKSGVIDDMSFLPVIFAADEGDDWTNEAVWAKANPSLGVTPSVEALRTDCNEAVESSAKENAFRRYHLNQWTEQDVRWLRLDKWDACGEPFTDELMAELEGQRCYAGLDLASTTDICALCLLFPRPGGEFVAMMRYWVPFEGARRRARKDRVPYEGWIKGGQMQATPGEVTDYEVIRADINGLKSKYNIREVAFDRWGATQLATQLDGDGFEMVAFGQGFASMSAPTKEIEKLVLAGKFKHGGEPVLRWMAGNVVAESDAAGNLKPSKKKSQEKIDGIVASIMALGRAMVGPQGESMYEHGGLRSL